MRVRCSLVAAVAVLASLAVPGVQAQPWLGPGAWLPEHRMGRMLLADPLEPWTGVVKSFGNRFVDGRLGIVRDIVRFEHVALPGVQRAALGASGQAIVQLKVRERERKPWYSFPYFLPRVIDTPLTNGDYGYGGHLVLEHTRGRVLLQTRLEVIHVSSHLGDNYYDTTANRWTHREPVEYSRNYGRVLLDARHRPSGVRAYGAAALMGYHSPVSGEEIPKSFLQGGAEWRGRLPNGLRPFLGADVRTFPPMSHTKSRTGASYVAGVRFGRWDRRGFELRLSRYNGASWRGQEYGFREALWGIGFRLATDD